MSCHTSPALVLLAASLLALPGAADDSPTPPAGVPPQAQAGEDNGADRDAAPSGPAGQLPWSSRDPQATPPKSPREMLELFDIGDSQLRSLFDGEPLGEADEDTVVKLMFRFPRMGEENIHRWRKQLPLKSLAEAPEQHRADVVVINGEVTRLERRDLIDELAKLYSFTHYWVLTVRPDDSDLELIVCAREIPKAWGDQPREKASFRVQIDGFFLKVGAREPKTQLVLAAPKARWLPSEPAAEFGVTASHVLLAQHGMDIGQIADLPEQNNKPLNAYDRSAFYDMLAAVRDMDDQALATPPPKADLGALLVHPETVHGERMAVRARAARITRVEVEGDDIHDRFGIDHYYTIDCYLPLGDQSVRLGEDENSPEYHNSFPATLCLIKLPPKMQDIGERMAAGESPTELLDRELEVDAFFFKVWSYRSEFIDDRTPGKLQPAPMLIAARMRMLRPTGVSADALSIVFGAGFVVLLGGVALMLWLTSRGDSELAKEQQDRRFQPSKPLNQLDLEASSEPDFSGLDEHDRSSPDASDPDERSSGEQ